MDGSISETGSIDLRMVKGIAKSWVLNSKKFDMVRNSRHADAAFPCCAHAMYAICFAGTVFTRAWYILSSY